MKKAHSGIPVKVLNYASEKNKKILRRDERIRNIINKADKYKSQKNVFEKILESLF